MMISKKSKVLILGIGNPYRKDDGVGRMIAQRLMNQNLPDVLIREMDGEGAKLIEAWEKAETVILVDAVSAKKKPGTLFHFDAAKETMPKDFFRYSSHAFSVAEAVELAKTLDQMPEQLLIYGIQGKDFSAGEGLSPEVEVAAKEVEKRVAQLVQGIEKGDQGISPFGLGVKGS